ncbi:Ribosomal protein L37ae [Trinorchestia longiramus]|nr:Ribosomal protein L37ae [Trinorchestia longiramus]
MAKRTKKVGIVGKYGTRYGASLRKQVKKQEESQRIKYFCKFCGRDSVKRLAVGIWRCKPCRRTSAGAAYSLHSIAATNAQSFIKRSKEMQEKE